MNPHARAADRERAVCGRRHRDQRGRRISPQPRTRLDDHQLIGATTASGGHRLLHERLRGPAHRANTSRPSPPERAEEQKEVYASYASGIHGRSDLGNSTRCESSKDTDPHLWMNCRRSDPPACGGAFSAAGRVGGTASRAISLPTQGHPPVVREERGVTGADRHTYRHAEEAQKGTRDPQGQNNSTARSTITVTHGEGARTPT